MSTPSASVVLKYFEHVEDILTYAKVSMSESEMSLGDFNPATMVLKLISEAEIPEKVEVTYRNSRRSARDCLWGGARNPYCGA